MGRAGSHGKAPERCNGGIGWEHMDMQAGNTGYADVYKQSSIPFYWLKLRNASDPGDPREESDDHSTRRGIRSLQAVDGGNSLSDGDEEDAAEPVTGAEDAR